MSESRMIFISYSHDDAKWRDRVRQHLGALTIDGRIDSWTDERIRTGADWRKEIRKALSSASAAILIVTPNFLSSPFIRKEEVTALLQRRHEDGMPIYAVIAEPCLWKKYSWLAAMQLVLLADEDKREPTSYEIDQALLKMVGEIDDALGAAPPLATAGTQPDSQPAGGQTAPPPSLEDRRRRIGQLLEQTPGDSIDNLPEGLLDLIADRGDVAVLEEKLTPGTPTTVLVNAINAIGLAVDWEWRHKVIKSPHSVAKLIALYAELDDVDVRSNILMAISKFPSTEIPFDFLIDRLAIDPPLLKANILAEMQFHVEKPYLSRVVLRRLLPLLHEFCGYPQEQCMYSDEFQGEMDFRYWVFRCLGAVGSRESVPIIEGFLATNVWPLDMLAEAANAHWDITQTTNYIDILRKAKKEGVAGNTEHALEEMEEYLGIKRPRTSKAKHGKPTRAKVPVKPRTSLKTKGRRR
jgi:TIR domain-containing protein